MKEEETLVFRSPGWAIFGFSLFGPAILVFSDFAFNTSRGKNKSGNFQENSINLLIRGFLLENLQNSEKIAGNFVKFEKKIFFQLLFSLPRGCIR